MVSAVPKVHKLKNRYKFTWFLVAKIHKSEFDKSRGRCTRNFLRCIYKQPKPDGMKKLINFCQAYYFVSG
jgi:hypothetical protein